MDSCTVCEAGSQLAPGPVECEPSLPGTNGPYDGVQPVPGTFKFTMVSKMSIGAYANPSVTILRRDFFGNREYVWNPGGWGGPVGIPFRGWISVGDLWPLPFRQAAFAPTLNIAEDPTTKPAGNPANDRRDGTNGQYRVYGKQAISFQCDCNNKVVNFRQIAGDEENDVGIEIAALVGGGAVALVPPAAIWHASPIQTQPYLRTMGPVAGPVNDVKFHWAVRGRPHPAAEIAFTWNVWPRNATYISTTVAGRAYCENGVGKLTVAATGTLFPTHRIWVNGTLAITLNQSSVSTLWRRAANPPFVVGSMVAHRAQEAVPP
jgi:hypothetical protein